MAWIGAWLCPSRTFSRPGLFVHRGPGDLWALFRSLPAPHSSLRYAAWRFCLSVYLDLSPLGICGLLQGWGAGSGGSCTGGTSWGGSIGLGLEGGTPGGRFGSSSGEIGGIGAGRIQNFHDLSPWTSSHLTVAAEASKWQTWSMAIIVTKDRFGLRLPTKWFLMTRHA
jgi:hypothetical protein